jgi:hypothetical protein
MTNEQTANDPYDAANEEMTLAYDRAKEDIAKLGLPTAVDNALQRFAGTLGTDANLAEVSGAAAYAETVLAACQTVLDAFTRPVKR